MAEYVARIEFAKQGYSIFIPEIDDRGVDMLVYREDVGYKSIQVKSIRGYQYVFMRKKYFTPRADLGLCLIVFLPSKFEIYDIPSTRWLSPCGVFCDRNYEGGKSAPEYGVNVSRKNLETLSAFRLISSPISPSVPVAASVAEG
ncbi:hypothetical protein Q8W71_30905 [Methylobacterium sp. NEAU 140]|uniref:hypothetical protein n=1 Tax=Methylobacterium sp. NEAU 140 TaxID=3064945 RepID=UPI002733D0AC|nr:hypothetical protein [Methylobacterium sp. NEAU 140]MDP4027002.1 hypothetical protein [Methylobacterium sp. NEAU 140]